jgi:pentatricopeptide repeat protein
MQTSNNLVAAACRSISKFIGFRRDAAAPAMTPAPVISHPAPVAASFEPVAFVETTAVPSEVEPAVVSLGDAAESGGDDVPDASLSNDPSSDLITLAASNAGENVQGRLHLARQARDQHRLDDAQELLLATNERFPNVPDVVGDLARLAETRHDWVAAEHWWREFSALAPHIWWALSAVGRAVREQGRVADADALVTELHERFPNEPAVFMEAARLAEQKGDWPEAEHQWGELAVRFPDSWESYRGRARILREQGELVGAHELLNQAVGRFPSSIELLHDLSRVAEAQQDWPEAERGWRSFIAVKPGVWWSYTALFESLCRQRRPEEAFATYADAREILPNEIHLCTVFVRAFGEAGYFDEARSVLAETLDRERNIAPRDLLHLGWSAIKCEDWEAAVDCARRLQVQFQEDPKNSADISEFEHLLQTRLAEVDPDMLAALDKARSNPRPSPIGAG